MAGEDLLDALAFSLAEHDGRHELVGGEALPDPRPRAHRFVGVQEAPQLVDDELRRARRENDQVTHQEMPPHRAQALLRDPLLHVAVEALAGQIAQAVGANALLAARAQRHHVRLGQPLAGIFVERARHLRSNGRQHLAVGVEVPGEDGAGVAVEQRVIDVEHRGGPLEGLHHFTSRYSPGPSNRRASSAGACGTRSCRP